METAPSRKPYPSDVSDDEWAFVAPYLVLMRPDAPQRHQDLREVDNALRWMVRTGAQWRALPHDLPPWEAVYQQAQRGMRAGRFADMVHDLRVLLRWTQSRADHPTAVILDSRTLQSSPESGARSSWDGAKKRKGSKTHMAVDPLGNLLALLVTPAKTNDRAPVADLTAAVQAETGHAVEVAVVDDGDTGPKPADAARAHGIELVVISLPEAKRGFVLLPRRWVVERRFGGAARFRRLARDSERLPETVAGLHFAAFAWLMTQQLVSAIAQSP